MDPDSDSDPSGSIVEIRIRIRIHGSQNLGSVPFLVYTKATNKAYPHSRSNYSTLPAYFNNNCQKKLGKSFSKDSLPTKTQLDLMDSVERANRVEECIYYKMFASEEEVERYKATRRSHLNTNEDNRTGANEICKSGADVNKVFENQFSLQQSAEQPTPPLTTSQRHKSLQQSNKQSAKKESLEPKAQKPTKPSLKLFSRPLTIKCLSHQKSSLPAFQSQPASVEKELEMHAREKINKVDSEMEKSLETKNISSKNIVNARESENRDTEAQQDEQNNTEQLHIKPNGSDQKDEDEKQCDDNDATLVNTTETTEFHTAINGDLSIANISSITGTSRAPLQKHELPSTFNLDYRNIDRQLKKIREDGKNVGDGNDSDELYRTCNLVFSSTFNYPLHSTVLPCDSSSLYSLEVPYCSGDEYDHYYDEVETDCTDKIFVSMDNNKQQQVTDVAKIHADGRTGVMEVETKDKNAIAFEKRLNEAKRLKNRNHPLTSSSYSVMLNSSQYDEDEDDAKMEGNARVRQQKINPTGKQFVCHQNKTAKKQLKRQQVVRFPVHQLSSGEYNVNTDHNVSYNTNNNKKSTDNNNKSTKLQRQSAKIDLTCIQEEFVDNQRSVRTKNFSTKNNIKSNKSDIKIVDDREVGDDNIVNEMDRENGNTNKRGRCSVKHCKKHHKYMQYIRQRHRHAKHFTNNQLATNYKVNRNDLKSTDGDYFLINGYKVTVVKKNVDKNIINYYKASDSIHFCNEGYIDNDNNVNGGQIPSQKNNYRNNNKSINNTDNINAIKIDSTMKNPNKDNSRNDYPSSNINSHNPVDDLPLGRTPSNRTSFTYCEQPQQQQQQQLQQQQQQQQQPQEQHRRYHVSHRNLKYLCSVKEKCMLFDEEFQRIMASSKAENFLKNENINDVINSKNYKIFQPFPLIYSC
ncbi:hypothetical protein HELRODRAFT_180087 [Helobdella robusta]|uniref:Uncharacterized protein n=1 Tax=Helobdella robusta TaxID=6412 RepID=T1FFG2_HELRO|nr:hypothetical protein HELRODRAFT_180087 [Helobdella robusta]ESN94757.1 hypothetical protein HELRODRAFT_180087 [Helobdella robusta]